MLVLSRKQGQSIRLPQEEVTITILRLSHGRVRLGITAPDKVLVMRDEIVEYALNGPTEPGNLLPRHG